MFEVTDLHAEYVRGAVTFVATSRPRLTWRTLTTTPNWTQSSAEVRVTRSDGRSENHRFDGAESVLVSWPFAPLGRPRAGHSVGAGDRHRRRDLRLGRRRSRVEAAFLGPDPWQADLVAHPGPDRPRPGAVHSGFHRPGRSGRRPVADHGARRLPGGDQLRGRRRRRAGSGLDQLRRATARADGRCHGVAACRREPAGRHCRRRLVRRELRLPRPCETCLSGPLSFLAQLELDYADGTTDVIATDARLVRHPVRPDRAERHLRRRTVRRAPRDRRLVLAREWRSPIWCR